MTLKDLPFHELMEEVLGQLKAQKYMDSTLAVYRRTYNRLYVFLQEIGTDTYTHETGHWFLENQKVCKSTLTQYACAIRRLDDRIDGNPYRCHHADSVPQIPECFLTLLSEYLSDCERIGNQPSTVRSKKFTCSQFLSFLEKKGCTDISALNTELVSQAILIYTNQDNYARIRQFLKYLSEREITDTDYSRIVPHHKRRRPLPSTYTPEEIIRLESVIDTGTNTGKRNLAIVRLASRLGLRSGDIAKLNLSEIDFHTGYIRLIQEKTGLPLAVRMPRDVEDSLLAHLDNDKHASEDGFVFHCMSAPYGRITTSVIRHAVNTCFNAAGIETVGKKHGPHTFRSSMATSMVNDGISYDVVRRLLGHSDPDTIKHYARADVENLRCCSLEPPAPVGLFDDYLSGKEVVFHV